MDYVLKFLVPLVIAAIVGLIKLYGNHTALKARHEALQDEVNELKHDVKTDFNKMQDHLDRRFDKIDSAFEKMQDNIQLRRITDNGTITQL